MHLTARSVPQCSRWAMIASTATAVLPVWRSPMRSCRWPRPMAVMASIAEMPVYSGSFTGCRETTFGACTSRLRRSVDGIGPLSSSGRPSASTTRPRKPSPTGIDRMVPVCLTGSPSSILSDSPRMMHPISSTSRLNASPKIPPGNSRSSFAMAPGSPWTRATPSAVSVTRPTSPRSTVGVQLSTFRRSASAMLAGSMFSAITRSLVLAWRPRDGSRSSRRRPRLRPAPPRRRSRSDRRRPSRRPSGPWRATAPRPGARAARRTGRPPFGPPRAHGLRSVDAMRASSSTILGMWRARPRSITNASRPSVIG